MLGQFVHRVPSLARRSIPPLFLRG
jgi:hypothetical protein